MAERITLTVEQLNTYVRDYLSTSPLLNNVSVKGEISNVRIYGKHIYFTLKDEKSSIPAIMFDAAAKIDFEPENGMKVVCTGRVAVFVRDGRYQLYADYMEPAEGKGSLFEQFEKLKEKLAKEGLFDERHKKALPAIPFSVGLITASTGAAVRDMINVTRRRFPAAKIYLYPSLVQGPNAPAELIKAVKELDASKLCDVIIIGRGGGSTEDLWCFNDEKLAHAVYDCETPIISAVGHEIDFTICDFVADKRAPTPSAAAEIAVPDVRELKNKFDNVNRKMSRSLEMRLDIERQKLKNLSERPVMRSPMNCFDEPKAQLLREEEKLYSASEKLLERYRAALALKGEKLISLDPLSILGRGFSVAFAKDGKAIKSVHELPSGTEFTLKLSDGQTEATAK